MLPGNPGQHCTRAEQAGGIVQPVHSVLAVFFFKGTSSGAEDRLDGVSTYLALTFGTLLSSQGTDASFETVSPVSPGASLRPFSLSAFRPFVFPTLPDPFSVPFPVRIPFPVAVGGPSLSVSPTLSEFSEPDSHRSEEHTSELQSH